MVSLINTQRICATAVLAFFVCGCRSSSVNSNPSVNRIPDPSGGSSYFRSYDRSRQSYGEDESYDSMEAPQPDPPGILPAPGYSDPGVPPAPPIPAAKKSRKSLVPSALRLPSTSRSNADVHQTGIKTDAGASKNITRDRSISNLVRVSPQATTEETVASRYAPAGKKLPRPASAPLRSNSSETPTLNQAESASATTAGEMPLLLPPSL